MLSVDDAIRMILAAAAPLDGEWVALAEAHGRVLAADLEARLTQPPFEACAMDGYAVRAADLGTLPARLQIVGEAAAGRGFAGAVTPGTCVRIFTGAPVPTGADTIIIQENTLPDGDWVGIQEAASPGVFIRPEGLDFRIGDRLLPRGTPLSARTLALAAAMNHATVFAHRKPHVAIIATGDELIEPGQTPAADQIISSVSIGMAGLVVAAGGVPVPLGIAKDTRQAVIDKLDAARSADVIVTIGGASVGEHDHVAGAIATAGGTFGFHKIAMRPGKPMIYGRLGTAHILGVPGNPVSALLCGRIFLHPLIRALSGATEPSPPPQRVPTLVPLEPNGPRQHYMRARLRHTPDGVAVEPLPNQDSSLLSALAAADCVIIRKPHAAEAPKGVAVPILPLDF